MTLLDATQQLSIVLLPTLNMKIQLILTLLRQILRLISKVM